MFFRYKRSYKKIAMGLLSFMPIENDVKQLQRIMQEYDTNPDWHLYLLKQNNDVVGAIGLKVVDNLNVVVQHISVIPSFRNMGIARKMVDEIKVLYGDRYDVCGNESTQQFISLHDIDNNKN